MRSNPFNSLSRRAPRHYRESPTRRVSGSIFPRVLFFLGAHPVAVFYSSFCSAFYFLFVVAVQHGSSTALACPVRLCHLCYTHRFDICPQGTFAFEFPLRGRGPVVFYLPQMLSFCSCMHRPSPTARIAAQ